MDQLIQLAQSVWGLWMMLLFLAIVAWTFWPSRKREHDEDAQIPFRNDD
jgi:cytochrome c oxidase cbb3-type subunit IV